MTLWEPAFTISWNETATFYPLRFIVWMLVVAALFGIYQRIKIIRDVESIRRRARPRDH